MAAENRVQTDYVNQRLLGQWDAMDFYHAVRMLECAYPQKPQVGDAVSPQQDVVTFGQNVSLAFAPSTLSAYELRQDPPGAIMSVNFMGLLGPNGPMPLYLTDFIRRRIRDYRDKALEEFLNIFNHRMISLFYKAWARSQKTVSFDRPKQDLFQMYFGSLSGCEFIDASDEGQDKIGRLFYSGRFITPVRNREGLQAVLVDYFKIPVQVIEYVGEWTDIPEDYRIRLGESRETGEIGRTLFIGSRIWESQHKFRVVFGPLTLAEYENFLPGKASLERAFSWIGQYVGGEYVWDLQLVIQSRDIPNTCLGQYGQLGYTVWLSSRTQQVDGDRLVISRRIA